MLSQELRPKSIDALAGQEDAKRVLKAIIKSPDKAPKVYIFQGAYGTGKSSSCRILARELNKLPDTLSDTELLNSKYYYEYDATVVGNVEEIRNLRDTLLVSYNDYWRVIVFDEIHSASNASMTALLKLLEEVQGKTIFILATTDSHKILDTIKSRSLEVEFKQVPLDDIVDNLTKVAEEKNIELSMTVKKLIAERSHGHMRNAHMLLDRYVLLGEVDFINSIKSSIDLYTRFLIACHKNDKDEVLVSLNHLLNIPKNMLQTDWSTVMVESLKVYNGFDSKYDCIYDIIDEYGVDFNIICKCYLSQWMQNAFTDMSYFQASMLNIYSIVSKSLAKEVRPNTTNVTANRFGKSVR